MIIDNQMIVSQSLWDAMPAAAKAALLKCDPPPRIMSDEEWNELGRLVKEYVKNQKKD